MATATENRINTHVAKKILRNAFAKNPNPSEQELERIAERCARPTYAVAKWFEKERDKTKSSQPATVARTSQLANNSTDNASLGASPTGNGSTTVQRTNGATSDRTQHDEHWDQYAPPRAADVPNVALGNELKHNLDVAMGLFYLTTLGQPMSFASEPR